ncbi:MAG: hypothetical protein AAGI01_05660, partial [Myxococcota bacterium]
MNSIIATKWGAGSVVGVFGVSLVMSAAIAMNADPPPKPKSDRGDSAKFEIAPKPPPKKKKVERKKPPPKKRTKARAKPAPPSVSSAIGGGAFEMPGFNIGQVGKDPNEMIGDVKDTVMTQDTVDQKPVPARRVSPQIPPGARTKSIGGFVNFTLLIGTTGQIERIKVLEAQPPGLFESAAREAI